MSALRYEPLTEAGSDWLSHRIQQLRSRSKSVGPFRAAGIQRTISGMRQQLRDGRWSPHVRPGAEPIPQPSE